MFRKLVGVLATLLMLSTVYIPQAGADQPVQFEFSLTFSDVNPCTGLDIDITLNLVIEEHMHQNNFVAKLRRTGSTSDGFIMQNGTESFVETPNGIRGSFMDQWRGPDGQKFRVRGVFNENHGELKTDQFSLLCIGN